MTPATRTVSTCQCEHVTHFDDGAPERLVQRYMAHGYSAVGTVAVREVPEVGGVCQECIDHGHLYEESLSREARPEKPP